MSRPRAGISDEALKKATGKDRAAWFKILDKVGAKKKQHREIVDLVHKTLKKKGTTNIVSSSGWWSQMVTVEYERARGLREVNENAQGFLVAVHKTVPMPLPNLEKAWQRIARSKAVKARKLEDLHSKTKRNMIRYKANPGGLVVMFDPRGASKSRIMVEAIKLTSKAQVERERVFWKKVLDNL